MQPLCVPGRRGASQRATDNAGRVSAAGGATRPETDDKGSVGANPPPAGFDSTISPPSRRGEPGIFGDGSPVFLMERLLEVFINDAHPGFDPV